MLYLYQTYLKYFSVYYNHEEFITSKFIDFCVCIKVVKIITNQIQDVFPGALMTQIWPQTQLFATFSSGKYDRCYEEGQRL